MLPNRVICVYANALRGTSSLEKVNCRAGKALKHLAGEKDQPNEV